MSAAVQPKEACNKNRAACSRVIPAGGMTKWLHDRARITATTAQAAKVAALCPAVIEAALAGAAGSGLIVGPLGGVSTVGMANSCVVMGLPSRLLRSLCRRRCGSSFALPYRGVHF